MQLDRIFDALPSPPRRAMLGALAQHECTTSELAQRLGMSAPAVSRHLSMLENAGLAVSRRDGQRVLYGLVRDTLMDALSTLAAELSAAPANATALPKAKREAI